MTTKTIAPHEPPPAPRTAAAEPEGGPGWKVQASWEKGAGLERDDGSFGIGVGLLLIDQFEMRFRDGEVARASFDMRMVRPAIRAHLFEPWIRIFVQPELAGPAARLLDLEMDVQPVPEFGVKVGQFITPFSRTFMTPVPKLQFAGFSIANDFFRGDRDTGAMIYGHVGAGKLEYYVGSFNGNRIDQGGNDNPSFAWFGRLATTIVGRPPPSSGHVIYDETPSVSGDVPLTIQVGVNGYLNDITATKQVFDDAANTFVTQTLPKRHQATAGADVSIHWQGFTLQAEAYVRRSSIEGQPEAVTSTGGYAQSGIFVIPKTLEIAARAATLRVDHQASETEVRSIEGQLGWYPLGNHLKLYGRYSLYDAKSVQQGLAQGKTHAATANLQFWF